MSSEVEARFFHDLQKSLLAKVAFLFGFGVGVVMFFLSGRYCKLILLARLTLLWPVSSVASGVRVYELEVGCWFSGS